LGLVVEYASGTGYEDYLNRNIFGPASLAHSFASLEKASVGGLAEGFRDLYGMNVRLDCKYPSGQVPAGFQLSSATDMAKYAAFYLGNGYYKGKSLITNNRLAPLEDPLRPFDGTEDYYGLDWGITNDPVVQDYNRFYGFMGATWNFNSAMLLSQVHRRAIIVLVNHRGSFRKPDIMAQVIGNGISDILLYEKMPASFKRTHDWQVFVTPMVVALLSAASIYSCFRFRRKMSKTNGLLMYAFEIIMHYISAVSVLAGLPLLYDIDWAFLLANAIDTGLPAFILAMALLVTGVVKTGLLLARVSCSRE